MESQLDSLASLCAGRSSVSKAPRQSDQDHRQKVHVDNDVDIKISENAMEPPDESRCSLGPEINFRSSISQPALSGLEYDDNNNINNDNSNSNNNNNNSNNYNINDDDDDDDNKEEERLPRVEQNQVEEEVVKKRRRKRIREVESLLRMQKGLKLGSSIIEYQKQGKPFSDYMHIYTHFLLMYRYALLPVALHLSYSAAFCYQN